MQVDLAAILLNTQGQPFKNGNEADSPDLTVGRAIVTALGVGLPEERDLDLGQKFARGALALKISEQETIDFTAEEVRTIKQLVGRLYNAVIVARLIPLLDPAATPPAMT